MQSYAVGTVRVIAAELSPHSTAAWVVLATLLASEGSGATQQEILEQVIVKVNGDVLTKTQIDERLRVTQSLTAAIGPLPQGAIALPQTPEVEVLPGILSDAIDELLLIQHAGDLGMAVAEAEIDQVLTTIKAQSGVDTDEAFQALLTGEGITLEGLRATTRRQILIARVKQQLFTRVSVSDEEARGYFDAYRAEFARPASVTFREVFVVVPAVGSVVEKTRDAALVKFVAAGDRLMSGMGFDQVARQYSEASSRTGGGLVGAIPLDSLDPLLRTALASLPPGGVSGPVWTAAGYYFLKLEGATSPVAPAFSDARGIVMERLLAVKERVALEALLTRLRASAILEWKRAGFESLYARRPR